MKKKVYRKLKESRLNARVKVDTEKIKEAVKKNSKKTKKEDK